VDNSVTAAKFNYVYTSAGNKTGLSIVERIVFEQESNICDNVAPETRIDETSSQAVLRAFFAAIFYFIISAVVISVCL
jgi:hypothetical protein